MDDEKLISLVENHTCLYDKHDKYFKNAEIKRDAWKAISKELTLPVKTCMRRWSALRERYSRELRLCAPSGSGSQKKTTWRLVGAMTFLMPHVKPRRSKSTKSILDRASTDDSMDLFYPNGLKPETEIVQRDDVDLNEFLVPLSPATSTCKVDDKKLISLVENYTFLYDKYNKYFKNADVREDAWKAISEELNLPVKMCMRRWRALRERYSREIRRSVPAENGNRKKTAWHLTSAMTFLKPHVKPRRSHVSKSKLDRASTDDSLDCSYPSGSNIVQSADVDFPEYLANLPSAAASCKVELNENPIASPESEAQLSMDDSVASTSNAGRIAFPATESIDNAFLDAVHCIIEVCKSQLNKENTVVENFGRMVVSAISGMSAAKRSKAIKEVTDLLMNIENEPE